VRLYLEETNNSVERAEACPIFGKGRHSCLGEEMSTWLWQTLAAEMVRLPFKFSVSNVNRRERDYVFTYYSTITVEFNA
jgi:hypothetical protein